MLNETYAQMKNRQQKEFNEFPCFFAFNRKQFDEGMAKLEVKCVGELYAGPGGMFYRKKDAPTLHEMMKRHDKEMKEARKEDKFLCKAIKEELANHEFCITYDWLPTLEALGISEEEVQKNERLRKVMVKAKKEYLKECGQS